MTSTNETETGETLVVVTGASRGIGAGIATAAAEEAGAGAAITVAACNRSASGFDPELIADLSDPEAWTLFADWYETLVAERSLGRVVCVHNSATLTPIGPAGLVDPEAYRAHVLLNSAAPQVLGGAVIATAHRHRVPTTLLQLSSGAASSPYPGWSGYCASKAAVEMWVQSVATEADHDGLVRVAAVRPGVVATAMQAEIRSSDEDAFPNVERFRDLHASGSLADPAEVGAKIWALANDTTWSSGDVLDVTRLA